MKEFLFVFRGDWNSLPEVSEEETKSRTKKWMDWVGGIAAQNKLVTKGNRLMHHGKIVKKNLVTDGPFIEMKEFIGGFSIVKANSYDEAVELANGCPVLLMGGEVEVREINAF
ncbi:MAG: transcription initiation protein [Cyclobacteriaceae bacterium]|nr:transcription initiation protein [Cyclobacteriaceae bacterium]